MTTSAFKKLTLLLALLFFVLLGASRIPSHPIQGTPFANSKTPVIPPYRNIGTPLPQISAEAFLIRRIRTGQILVEKDANQPLAIASLTKLMTALIIARESSPLEVVSMTAAAKQAGELDDKRSDLRVGERLKIEDLLRTMLIASNNDAAWMGAEAIAAGQNSEGDFENHTQAFVEEMNTEAGTLHLEHTHFENPTGNDRANHVSSAYDLALLAEAIERDHPELWRLSREREAILFSEQGTRHTLTNTNPLLGEFPSIYGSKTGFDDRARGALLMLYERFPHDPIIIVLLKSEDRFGDGRKFLTWLDTSFTLPSTDSVVQ